MCKTYFCLKCTEITKHKKKSKKCTECGTHAISTILVPRAEEIDHSINRLQQQDRNSRIDWSDYSTT